MKVAFFYGRIMHDYIAKDLNLLKRHSEVREMSLNGLKQLREISDAVRWADVSLSWFPGERTALVILVSTIMKKPSVLITGGSMVLCEDYSAVKKENVYYRWTYRIASAWCARHADLLLPVSQYEMDGIKMRHEVKNMVLSYHGFDPERFKFSDKKEVLVLSTSIINSEYYARKRLDVLIEAAKALPEVKFVLTGRISDEDLGNKLEREMPPNFSLAGFVSGDTLHNYFQRAKVYAQVSWQEGFGCAIAEAMLCGCIPVVTPAGAIPEVVGDTGFYAGIGDVSGTVGAIRKALNCNDGQRPRDRIMNCFPLTNREDILISSIKKAIENARK